MCAGIYAKKLQPDFTIYVKHIHKLYSNNPEVDDIGYMYEREPYTTITNREQVKIFCLKLKILLSTKVLCIYIFNLKFNFYKRKLLT